MKKQPKYEKGDVVEFLVNDIHKIGKIMVVDSWNSCYRHIEYDILVDEENMLYKHFSENLIIRKVDP